ncbi:inducible metalloproteinase inhibitor protein [Stomoxys calcitrans]|uniref:inducible metalloproteinase inhibitor protein n=1 Tax=Stomoxys calcitrans TaxID=35570 RepID=UPI0027E33728|nr:inducible metalloproteinase inhibitor protein [Stomoxys calcitrans]
MAKTSSRNLIIICLTLWALVAVVGAVARSCPQNEFYTDCGDSCQTECATLNKPCLIAHFRCPDGCYCNKGYARDASGACIPIDKCPYS